MTSFFTETFLPIWQAGGPLMYPLAALAFLIYFTGVELVTYLNRLAGKSADSALISQWARDPKSAEGEAGKMIWYAQEGSQDAHEVAMRYGEIRTELLGRVDRRRLMLSVLVSAAPLTGLLGTVMGMLETFKGLAISGGGETVGLVAGGISQALITTQLGLIIAIPGYLILSSIEKRRNRLESLVTSLECKTMQKFQQRPRQRTTTAVSQNRGKVRHEAKAAI